MDNVYNVDTYTLYEFEKDWWLCGSW
jgi:hypothetical protein